MATTSTRSDSKKTWSVILVWALVLTGAGASKISAFAQGRAVGLNAKPFRLTRKDATDFGVGCLVVAIFLFGVLMGVLSH